MRRIVYVRTESAKLVRREPNKRSALPSYVNTDKPVPKFAKKLPRNVNAT